MRDGSAQRNVRDLRNYKTAKATKRLRSRSITV